MEENKESISIPIFVDSVKNYEEFNMTRCSFYTVESNIPIPNWDLDLQNRNIQVHLLGGSGIVFKPFGGVKLFESPKLIDDFFDNIEQDPLYIDSDFIWLPNYLFKEPKRGQVYRIGVDLFNYANHFKEKMISLRQFNSICDKYHDSIHYSEKETEAFFEWEQEKIKEVRDNYYEEFKERIEEQKKVKR